MNCNTRYRCSTDSCKEVRRLCVSVSFDYSGSSGTPVETHRAKSTVIGAISVSSRSSWDTVDSDVCRAFNEYLHRCARFIGTIEQQYALPRTAEWIRSPR